MAKSLEKDEKKLPEKKVNKKNSTKKNVKKEKKVKKESYLKGVRKEMKLVKWPTWKEVIKNTIATIVLCLIVCGFFLLLNLLLSIVKGWFVA